MKKYILLFSGILSIWFTTYISLLPLNWFNQADVSNMYATSITPAGFTFSIWSIIYLSWLVLGFYNIFYKKKEKIKKQDIYLLASAQILTVLWLIPWHYNFIWMSLVIMLWILWTLWYLSTKHMKDKLFQWTVYLFFGWILVATIANIHIFLVSADLYIFPIVFWVISLILWAYINSYIIKKYSSIIPAIVFIWALIWIISNHTNIYIISTSYAIIFILWVIIYKNKMNIKN